MGTDIEAIPSPAPMIARPSNSSHRVLAIPRLIDPIPNKTDDMIIVHRRPIDLFSHPPRRENKQATPTVIPTTASIS